MPEKKSYHFVSESDPDVLLMLEFQKGDRASFENLMHKYYKRIFNFVYRMIGSRGTADALTLDIFFEVYQSVKIYRPHVRFRTWIYMIAKNRILNELRLSGGRPDLLNVPSAIKNNFFPADQIPEDTQDARFFSGKNRRDRVRAVQDAVKRLPVNQRMALVLYRYERFFYEEIAQVMEINFSVVKSLLSQARQNLYDALKPFIMQKA